MIMTTIVGSKKRRKFCVLLGQSVVIAGFSRFTVTGVIIGILINKTTGLPDKGKRCIMKLGVIGYGDESAES